MIVVDTGFWLALANKKDESHPVAKNLAMAVFFLLTIVTSTSIAGKILSLLKICCYSLNKIDSSDKRLSFEPLIIVSNLMPTTPTSTALPVSAQSSTLS